MTAKKYKQLQDELEEMKSVGRKVLADKLELYRSDGNSEEGNAYNEILEEKFTMDDRVSELSEMLANAEVTNGKCSRVTVEIGCPVTIQRNGKQVKYYVVSGVEANPSEKKISEDSPLGKAVIGKKVGDSIEIDTPNEKCKCKIVSIG
ncbi:MAG: GreA/GreB family elongation factor [Patescibacteria group bacterium]|nr:GreA/GreB family elongation factor [Patescibacteria group bacterium]